MLKSLPKTGDTGPKHNFTNSSLALPWEPEEGHRVDDERLCSCVTVVLAGWFLKRRLVSLRFDTQDYGFWYVVRAWGADLESWLLYEGFLTDWDGVIAVLEKYELKDVDGNEYIINLALIDSQGHRTSEVYDFCRTRPNVIPIKGEQTMSQPFKVSRGRHVSRNKQSNTGGTQSVAPQYYVLQRHDEWQDVCFSSRCRGISFFTLRLNRAAIT